MADDDVQYEMKTVQAIRGTEARAKAKWQKEGWERVSENKGALRTEITFRRPKRNVRWPLITVAGGAAAVLIAVAVATGIFDHGPGSATADPAVPPVATQPGPGESAPTQSAAAEVTPNQETVQTTEAAKPVEESVLTAENNGDLSAILSLPEYCDEKIRDFAAKYKGQKIAFDANVGAMGPHGTYDTRYDILIGPGNDIATVGPTFQFRDVNTTFDLHFTDSERPATVGVGDNLRITAEVDKYEEASCLFLLKPISTEFR